MLEVMMKKSGHSFDMVEVVTSDGAYKGVLMPSSDSTKIVVKLKSGYNIGLLRKHVKKILVLEHVKTSKATAAKKLVERKHLPVISILHFGGTIASEVDYTTGAVVARFTPEELVAKFPELEEIANIRSRLIRNMFSEDMRFAHYNLLAKEIAKEISSGADGVIVTHGTDTLGYTASALAFMLEHLSVPVLLVGSQRSSDRGSSDAAMNLICAAHFISKSDFAGACVCMHEKSSDDFCSILPACKVRKMHTSRRDAFKAINSVPIAKVDMKGSLEFVQTNYKRKSKEKVIVKVFKENLRIGMLKVHPNMHVQEFLSYKNFDGLVIEGTGLGHAPVNVIDEQTKEHKKIFDAIRSLSKNIPVVMTSQTIFGRVQMNVYSTGRMLQEIGVLGNYCDMLPETAFIKLAWLLSNYKKDDVKRMIGENLRGEISKRTQENEYL